MANSKLFRPTNDGNKVVQLNCGMAILVSEHDYVSRMVRFFGDFDPSLTRLLGQLIVPGDAVLDIGANLGVVTLPAAKLVGNHGLVCAFEPQSRVCSMLSNSIRLNALENVCLYEMALSNFDGYSRIASDPNSMGTASLKALEIDENSEICDVRSLDGLELPLGGRRVGLVKLDVEGHEAQVLEGGLAFLRRCKPENILFESHSYLGTFQRRREMQLLHELGYTIFAIKRTLFGAPKLFDIRTHPDLATACSDYLAKLEMTT